MNDPSIHERLAGIVKRMETAAVACGRDARSVKLVTVSKTRSVDDIRSAASAGALIFGENYVKEASEKIALLQDLNKPFHLIGHLQSNKAKTAVRLFDLIHSVDSTGLAAELDRQAKKIHKIQDILIQVNVGMEESKSGIDEDGLEPLLRSIHTFENIRVLGLMTIPPFDLDPEAVRPYFRALRIAAEKIRALDLPNIRLDELSMGMTGDFETAIEEGATFVRIGTAIFGERS